MGFGVVEKRLCTRCKRSLDISNFRWRTREQKQRNCYCNECMKLYRKEHYHSNPTPYLDRAKSRITEVKRLYLQYMTEHACVDCGEDDPVLLEPDHVRGEKTAGVSKILRLRSSWEKVEEELKKCDIRCVSCHRRKTAREQNWYKFLGVTVKATARPPKP